MKSALALLIGAVGFFGCTLPHGDSCTDPPFASGTFRSSGELTAGDAGSEVGAAAKTLALDMDARLATITYTKAGVTVVETYRVSR